MKKNISTVLFLVNFFSIAQIPDSLISLANEKPSIDLVEKGLLYTQNYLNSDLELAHYCAERTYELSLSLNNPIKIAEALDNLGEVNRKSGNYTVAIDYLTSAMTLKKTAKADTLLHLSYNLLGKVYFNKGQHDSAVYNFILAAEEMDKQNNLEGKAYYLNNIGVVFDMNNMYDKALEYYFKSLEIKKEIKLTNAFGASYTNIGIVYFNLGNIKQSLVFHRAALHEYQLQDNQEGIAKAYNNIGFAEQELKNYDAALLNFMESLTIRKKQKNPRAEGVTENNIALVYFKLNRLDSAIAYNNAALLKIQAIGDLNILKEVYATRTEILEAKGEFEQALATYKLFVDVSDSLLHPDIYETIAEMEAKYNVVQKENELIEKNYLLGVERFERERQKSMITLYFVISAGLLVSCFLFVLAYLRKRRIVATVNAQNLLIQKEINQLQRIKSVLVAELEDKKELLDKVFDSKGSQDLPEELLQLSKREVEVLATLALGWTDQQIAEKLFVSKATVKTHLRRIYSKLLVNSRSAAVAIAHKYQIIGQIAEEKA